MDKNYVKTKGIFVSAAICAKGCAFFPKNRKRRECGRGKKRLIGKSREGGGPGSPLPDGILQEKLRKYNEYYSRLGAYRNFAAESVDAGEKVWYDMTRVSMKSLYLLE